MRLMLFVNNWVGWQVAAWLRTQGAQIVAVAVHPAARARYRSEILAAVGPDAQIFEADSLRQPQTLEAIAACAPSLGVSGFFGYILRPALLDLLREGCVNLHPALLPANRGANPNVWSIVDGTPAGATLHYMDSGVDTGDIVAQLEVPVEPIDTGATLYRKLELASLTLFQHSWPLLCQGAAPRLPQQSGGGSHRLADLAKLDLIDPERSYKAGELIALLRARSFPPYNGAYLCIDGRRVYLRLELAYGDELGEGA